MGGLGAACHPFSGTENEGREKEASTEGWGFLVGKMKFALGHFFFSREGSWGSKAR